MEENQYVLDFFAGGVPPFPIFRVNLQNLAELLDVPFIGDAHTARELALIGVVAYTEAFFKDFFSAVVNIFPEKIAVLRERGRDVSIDLTDVLSLEGPLKSKLGFLLSERFDFGTPRSINSLFRGLLLVTPFSKERASELDRILAIRNLLVHHGGTLTTHFNRAGIITDAASDSLEDRTFYDSVNVTKKLVGTAALLALDVAKGTVSAAISELSDEIRGLPKDDVRCKAVKTMAPEPEEDEGLRAALSALIAGESPEQPADGISDGDIPF